LLPVKFLTFDPFPVERVVVQVAIIRFLRDHFSHLVLDVLDFFLMGWEIKNCLHFDGNIVHGVLKHNLLFFDLLFHKISSKNEGYLRIKALFSNFLHHTA
jgi:hypothetical protein